MQSHEEEFLNGIINDFVDAEDYHDIMEEMLDEEYGRREYDEKFAYIKRNLTGEMTGELAGAFTYQIGGEVEEFANLINLDLDYSSDIDEKRSIWEGTDYSDEIQEKYDELNEPDEEEDEDEDW